MEKAREGRHRKATNSLMPGICPGHGARYCGAASGVAWRNPGDLAEFDALLGQFARFLGGRLAIDAARIDLAVMDFARLLGEALADIVAIRFDLTAQFEQGRAHLSRRQRRDVLVRTPDIRRHQRLFDPVIAAGRTGDLARLLLRIEGIAAAEPALEFVLGVATQREPDHRKCPPGTCLCLYPKPRF